MTSASSTAFLTASMAWSRLMMLPRRVPFIGAVPLPMISSWLRSLASPTSTQTLEVPISSATTYFSSVFGIDDSCRFGGRRRSRRFRRFDDDAIRESEIRVTDGGAIEPFRPRDGVQIAPLRREIARVRVDDRVELAIEERECVRRNGADLGDSGVDVRVARAQRAQEHDAALQLRTGGVRDDGQIAVTSRRRELRERRAALVDVLQFVAGLQQRDGRALDDADAQRAGKLLLRVDAADPSELA